MLISYALAMVLVLTSQAMAIARGGADATDQRFLCIGGQVALVYVDQEGVPVEAPHFCPECTLTAELPTRAVAPKPIETLVRDDAQRLSTAQLIAAAQHRTQQSRAPPKVV
ncbi:MAG: hypothetical protein AAF307_08425 [Pseudomonadota bacterium]